MFERHAVPLKKKSKYDYMDSNKYKSNVYQNVITPLGYC